LQLRPTAAASRRFRATRWRGTSGMTRSPEA
jgi:hypothetical protein